MRTTRYPVPTPERRRIVQELSEHARSLDAEAEARKSGGSHNSVVRHELLNSAAVIRLVSTLIVQGGMSTQKARFWLASTRDYMKLVDRADSTGVIR